MIARIAAVEPKRFKGASASWCPQVQTQFREMGAEECEAAMGAPPLSKFVGASEAAFDVALQQNEIANLFLDDWELLAEDDEILAGHSDTHLREYQSFTGKRLEGSRWRCLHLYCTRTRTCRARLQ